jgi:protein-S-isoprenylcysteine O-methyltransferase Ste14
MIAFYSKALVAALLCSAGNLGLAFTIPIRSSACSSGSSTAHLSPSSTCLRSKRNPYNARATTNIYNNNSNTSKNAVTNSIDNFLNNLPIDLNSVRSNILEGTVGERGELYVAAQLACLACIATGTVPIGAHTLYLLFGPGLFGLGIVVMASSVATLGPALSPYPVVASNKKGALQTQGIYARIRHPMYAGLFAACAGFSVGSGSASRLLLTLVLLWVINEKSDKEEQDLRAVYGAEYDAYAERVEGKFVPQAWLDALPWTK